MTHTLNNADADEDARLRCQHNFIDADNNGEYGEEECRFCGHKQKKGVEE